MHKQSNILLIIFIAILFVSCNKCPAPTDPSDNSPPTIERIYLPDISGENTLLEYGSEYEVICEATDIENDSLTYMWIISSSRYSPYTWQMYSDTLITNTNSTIWRANTTGEVFITCKVVDTDGAHSSITERQDVNNPSELTSHKWKVESLFFDESHPTDTVSGDYYLDFGVVPAYTYMNDCRVWFGRTSVVNDTLSFQFLSTEQYSDSCSFSDVNTIVNHYFFENKYLYTVNSDTLDLFYANSTTNTVIVRCLATNE